MNVPTPPTSKQYTLPQSGAAVSVVVEWKNQDLAADERADAMLAAVKRQWLALQATAPPLMQRLQTVLELVFIYDGAAARRNLDRQLEGRFETHHQAFQVKLIAGEDLSYYGMKHLGATKAKGDILIFLDSDVIPEPTWLAAILDAIIKDEILIVCGNTYIDPVDLLGKAFALAWFFPLRSQQTGLQLDAKCYSNNLAIRALLYREFPFIEVPGTTRTVMPQLTTRLADRGIAMHKCLQAQTSHPHPRGMMHFLKRAIVHGRDIYFKTNHDAKRDLAQRRLGDVLNEVWSRYSAGMKRAARHYRQVDLRLPWVPLVMLIMTLYYLVFAIGSIRTHIAPGPMSQALKI